MSTSVLGLQRGIFFRLYIEPSILFHTLQWQLKCVKVPFLCHFCIYFKYRWTCVFMSWICMKYLSLDVNQLIIDNPLYFLLQFLKLYHYDQTYWERKILPRYNVQSCDTSVLEKCMKTLTFDVGIGVQTQVSYIKLEVRSQCS